MKTGVLLLVCLLGRHVTAEANVGRNATLQLRV